MRAEAQAHIEQINAATALLRRFLDWDRALKRLDELNAKVEDASLWNDPKAAQDVMRERRRLEEAIGATRKIERELAELCELTHPTQVVDGREQQHRAALAWTCSRQQLEEFDVVGDGQGQPFVERGVAAAVDLGEQPEPAGQLVDFRRMRHWLDNLWRTCDTGAFMAATVSTLVIVT